jgi:hypothetical protein
LEELSYVSPEGVGNDATSLNPVLKQLQSAIDGEAATATFACGGSIAVDFSEVNKGPTAKNPDDGSLGLDLPETTASVNSETPTLTPVSIYWSPEQNENAKRLSLPLDQSDSTSANALEQLVRDCAPATFGRGDKDVLDPEYRSAGKLDTDSFCTTFHPANFGILETIEQILLPSVNSSSKGNSRFRRVRAELYKLNVCFHIYHE